MVMELLELKFLSTETRCVCVSVHSKVWSCLGDQCDSVCRWTLSSWLTLGSFIHLGVARTLCTNWNLCVPDTLFSQHTHTRTKSKICKTLNSNPLLLWNWHCDSIYTHKLFYQRLRQFIWNCQHFFVCLEIGGIVFVCFWIYELTTLFYLTFCHEKDPVNTYLFAMVLFSSVTQHVHLFHT